ncbi:MAG: hypothetical protein KKF48_03675 [Nanoarchaeota archaeon]|nr:hypothetical protein [Nanoarchaeota archaeon]MBU1028119.1 hypothetical protein [Nanoarchaeota archaeon]
MKKRTKNTSKISIKKEIKGTKKSPRFSLKIEGSQPFFKALLSLIGISIVIIAVSSYFIFKSRWIGFVFLGLGILNILFMKLLGIKLKFIYPDLTFGFVDNGVMVFAAIIGGSFGGITGAIIGGVAGNTITDGLGGFFEGYVSERQTALTKFKSERRMLSSSLGKMTGCMFGAGISLMVAWVINLI